jgi:hypothetical protein
MAIDFFRVSDFVEDVRTKKYYLPAIQRELVRGMDRIERLFDSLLCSYPVGIMLRWRVFPRQSRCRRPVFPRFLSGPARPTSYYTATSAWPSASTVRV